MPKNDTPSFPSDSNSAASIILCDDLSTLSAGDNTTIITHLLSIATAQPEHTTTPSEMRQ